MAWTQSQSPTQHDPERITAYCKNRCNNGSHQHRVIIIPFKSSNQHGCDPNHGQERSTVSDTIRLTGTARPRHQPGRPTSLVPPSGRNRAQSFAAPRVIRGRQQTLCPHPHPHPTPIYYATFPREKKSRNARLGRRSATREAPPPPPLGGASERLRQEASPGLQRKGGGVLGGPTSGRSRALLAKSYVNQAT